MSKLSFVALSLQTTHLDPASVSKAAYVKLVDGNITRADAVPVIPPTSHSAADQSSTAHPITWNQALPQLSMMIGKLPIVSYYRDADKEIFQAASRHVQEEPPAFHWLDCRELARKLLPNLPDVQLSTVLQALNLYDDYADSSAVEQTTQIVLALAQREDAADVEELWGELYEQPDDFLGLETTFESLTGPETGNDGAVPAPVLSAPATPFHDDAADDGEPQTVTQAEESVQADPDTGHEASESATTQPIQSAAEAHASDSGVDLGDDIPEFLKETDAEKSEVMDQGAALPTDSDAAQSASMDQIEEQQAAKSEDPADSTPLPMDAEQLFSSEQVEEPVDHGATTQAAQAATQEPTFAHDPAVDNSGVSPDEDVLENVENELSTGDAESTPQQQDTEDTATNEAVVAPGGTAPEELPVFLQDRQADDATHTAQYEPHQANHQAESLLEDASAGRPVDPQKESAELSETVAPEIEEPSSDQTDTVVASAEASVENTTVNQPQDTAWTTAPRKSETSQGLPVIALPEHSESTTPAVHTSKAGRLFGLIGLCVFGLISIVGLGLSVMATMLFFTTNTLLLETKIAGLILTVAVTLLSLLMANVSYRNYRKK